MKGIGGIWAALAGLCIPILQAHADPASELDDAAARLHYAFFTADARAMEEAVALVTRLESPASLPGMKEYYAAYGYWKLAQIHDEAATRGSATERGAISKAAQACQKQAELAVEQDRRMAEAYAIAAACSAFVPSLTSSGCAKSKLRTALELDPSSPRVLLIEALCSAQSDPSPASGTEKLRALVAAFESAPPSRPGKPDWGQAEALVLLGENYLQRGDALAAREAIERALVIAPDYRRAQELLQNAAARPK